MGVNLTINLSLLSKKECLSFLLSEVVTKLANWRNYFNQNASTIQQPELVFSF